MAAFTLSVTRRGTAKVFLIFAIALLTKACAAMQPADAGGPRFSGRPYPVVLAEQAERRNASVLALNRRAPTNGQSDQDEAYLQTVTATIKSLPPHLTTPLYLPKVGNTPAMNEEETREALRRFINDWRGLIGGDPSQLSLVERIDQPDGTKIARYEQRPFRYPLRGDYGKLQIHFKSDRRLVDISSTCIPDAEHLQAALAGLTPRVNAEDALAHVRESGIMYSDSFGRQQSYRLSASNEINATELVTYALPSSSRGNALELRIAWEISVTNAPFKKAYLDAIEETIIAAW